MAITATEKAAPSAAALRVRELYRQMLVLSHDATDRSEGAFGDILGLTEISDVMACRSVSVGVVAFLRAIGPGAKRGAGSVYVAECTMSGAVKIGWSTDPVSRLQTLQTGSPYELYLVTTIVGTPADEAALHSLFKSDRIHGEWFRPAARARILAAVESRGRR